MLEKSFLIFFEQFENLASNFFIEVKTASVRNFVSIFSFARDFDKNAWNSSSFIIKIKTYKKKTVGYKLQIKELKVELFQI